MLGKLPVRRQDSYGEGHFGAQRSKLVKGDIVYYEHEAIDYCCYPGTKVLAPVSGIVTKLGYPYGDDLAFRYVEVTAIDALRYRTFYIEPSVKLGEAVMMGETIIGVSQRLGERYPANDRHKYPITEHIHFEIRNKAGDYFNPDEVMNL